MNLMSIGNVIVNLDRIAALDFENHPNGTVSLRLYSESNQPVLTFDLPDNSLAGLMMNTVPASMRFSGRRRRRK